MHNVYWTKPKVNTDERGSMSEAFRQTELHGMPAIAQVNVSRSHKGVLRGIHWHVMQWDAWHLAIGTAQVAIHDRFSGKIAVRTLTQGEGVVIPPGFGHGFLALSPIILLYGVSHEFNKPKPDEQEYHAYSVGIPWDLEETSVLMSERDRRAEPWQPLS